MLFFGFHFTFRLSLVLNDFVSSPRGILLRRQLLRRHTIKKVYKKNICLCVVEADLSMRVDDLASFVYILRGCIREARIVARDEMVGSFACSDISVRSPVRSLVHVRTRAYIKALRAHCVYVWVRRGVTTTNGVFSSVCLLPVLSIGSGFSTGIVFDPV